MTKYLIQGVHKTKITDTDLKDFKIIEEIYNQITKNRTYKDYDSFMNRMIKEFEKRSNSILYTWKHIIIVGYWNKHVCSEHYDTTLVILDIEEA